MITTHSHARVVARSWRCSPVLCYNDMESNMAFRWMCVLIGLLFCSSAFGQSYEMKIHLSNGTTVAIPNSDVRRIEFKQTSTGVEDAAGLGAAPLAFRLLQNYPNPFNPSTTIQYETATLADVNVRIFDLRGALIKELVHSTQAAGLHRVVWDGTDSKSARVSSGVYFSVVDCGGQALSRRLILIK
jgi:hypothetical protein